MYAYETSIKKKMRIKRNTSNITNIYYPNIKTVQKKAHHNNSIQFHKSILLLIIFIM